MSSDSTICTILICKLPRASNGFHALLSSNKMIKGERPYKASGRGNYTSCTHIRSPNEKLTMKPSSIAHPVPSTMAQQLLASPLSQKECHQWSSKDHHRSASWRPFLLLRHSLPSRPQQKHLLSNNYDCFPAIIVKLQDNSSIISEIIITGIKECTQIVLSTAVQQEQT